MADRSNMSLTYVLAGLRIGPMAIRADNHSQRESELGITIRRLGEADAVAVRELAGLDSTSVPDGECLGVEVDGRLLAMQPLAYRGAVIADPFARTAEIRALLEVRTAQLRARSAPRATLADPAPAGEWPASAPPVRPAN